MPGPQQATCPPAYRRIAAGFLCVERKGQSHARIGAADGCVHDGNAVVQGSCHGRDSLSGQTEQVGAGRRRQWVLSAL